MTISSSSALFDSRVSELLRWVGLASVYETGKDAWLIIIARSCRMFAYGANSTFIALFFSALGFSDFRIGVFMSLTMVGDVFLTLILTALADNLGRRRTLLFGSGMMVVSGLVFATMENYWILLLAAIVGVISPAGGDFGPFRAIEESVLSQLTSAEGRSNVLSWYVTSGSFGSAIGSEIAGHILQAALTKSNDSKVPSQARSSIDGYHACFGLYVLFGLVNIGCALLLSPHVELSESKRASATTEAGEAEMSLLENVDETAHGSSDALQLPNAATSDGKSTSTSLRRSYLARISKPTRAVMLRIWLLLALDSMADGMASLSLTSYYLDAKFHVSASTLGHIISIAYFLAAFSTILAGPLANRIGLVNTMVFTHVPSSAAVLLFPLPSGLALTIILFFLRMGLNNMDQAPRAAFIAAVVRPEERTAVNGITTMLRTLASTIGPTLTGGLAQQGRFWIAFVLAGSLRLIYDFGLWASFVNMPIDTS